MLHLLLGVNAPLRIQPAFLAHTLIRCLDDTTPKAVASARTRTRVVLTATESAQHFFVTRFLPAVRWSRVPLLKEIKDVALDLIPALYEKAQVPEANVA